MTLTETFPTRPDALAHAERQQKAFTSARVLVSAVPGGFTVQTTIRGDAE